MREPEVAARDLDPEDAYDAGDPLPVRLGLLRRVIESIRDERLTDAARADVRRAALLALIERMDDEFSGTLAELMALRDAAERA